MWKFIAGYAFGLVVALGVVAYSDRPAKSEVNQYIAWYAVADVALPQDEEGKIIFEKASSTEAECVDWLKTTEFKDQLDEMMGYILKKYPKSRVSEIRCAQPGHKEDPV